MIISTTPELVFFSSIPKSGSNLLLKLLMNLKGEYHVISCLDQTHLKHNPTACQYSKEKDRPIDYKKINWSHLIFNDELFVIKDTTINKRLFFIYRDPRDQIVSAAHYVYRLPHKWPLHCHKPMDELLTELINDCQPIFDCFVCSKEPVKYRTIKDFYDLFLPWKNAPGVYTTTFENLIGPSGGGSIEAQQKEIERIGHHLEIELSFEEIQNISMILWGKTFREGKIGSWKQHFNEEHKRLFKEVAGTLLIDLGYEKDLNW